MKQLTFQDWIEYAENFELSKNDSYAKSYPEFISYFKGIKKIEKHHLVIASHFVYGWMPRTLTLKYTEESLPKLLKLLNDAKDKNADRLNKKEIETIKECVNNSLVGTSKLLHFINPHKYAIWDSKIFKNLTGKSQYGINKIENYFCYLDMVDEISKHKEDKDYQEVQKSIRKKLGYPEDFEITPMRLIELVIFQKEKNS